MTTEGSRLGLRRGDVKVVDHDPAWTQCFLAEAERLQTLVAAAGLPPLAFEHIGSTAVPGLAAKPILDFMAGHAVGCEARVFFDVLTAAGYQRRGAQGVPERELFVLGPEKARTHHLNLIRAGGPFWRQHIKFRDQLRADQALAGAYAALKRGLAARHPTDRGAYTAAKARFVEAVLHDETSSGTRQQRIARDSPEASLSSIPYWRARESGR
jgi:GrpB-like predicted nucleotidyltransferase (UPF0157 family)